MDYSIWFMIFDIFIYKNNMEQKVIAAGLVAICPETGRFLLLKRAENIKYPGYWNLHGGVLDEKDKYPKITAIREFREETGYNGIVKISKQPLYVDKTNQLDFYTYAGILPNEFTPNLKGECVHGSESLDFGWFPISCKWEYNDNIIPNIIKMLDLKEGTLKGIVNKFKNKNF